MRIYGALDKNRFQSAADKSRARHLFNLMNEQEADEQDYYNKSTASYNKSQIYKLSSDVEDYIEDYVGSTNVDINSTIKEYGLYGVDIWDYIEDDVKGLKQSWRRGDGIKYAVIYESWRSSLTAYVGGEPAFAVAIYQGDNHGNPDDYYFGIEWLEADKILSNVYDVYSKSHSYNEDEFYDYTIKILDSILSMISEVIEYSIEKCLDDNPPALG